MAPADAPEAMRADVLGGAPGEAWDRLYIRYAITMHEAAIENTARALAATRRPEVKQLIERSVPILDKHLNKARSMEQRMSGQPADSGGSR